MHETRVSMEAYFDESGTHAESKIICVAGYLFTVEQRQRFDQEWRDVLQEFKLPYFHMTDCAHTRGPFAERPEICDPVARRMIGIIKRRAERGMATSAPEKDFAAYIPKHWQRTTGPAYSWCVRWAFSLVRDWIEKFGLDGTVLYFFESGHGDQNITNQIMRNLFGARRGPEDPYRYESHKFASKVPNDRYPDECLPLQAADLLAWQYRTHKLREAQGKQRRRDFESLLECPHVSVDWTSETMDDWVKQVYHEILAKQ